MKVELPVDAYVQRIVAAVQTHDVVVITGETGSGKSTRIPPMLHEAGYNVTITQPRRMAARTVAERVASEVGSSFGGLVGYRTAEEAIVSPETKILFCTDGLLLPGGLRRFGAHDVLMIDEAHEMNSNIEVLIALAKRRFAEGKKFKLVLSSATLNVQELLDFFDDAVHIDVPGRTYPVEEIDLGTDLVEATATLARQGHTILVFVEGKTEIRKTIKELERRRLPQVILPLHGELPTREQDPVLASYPTGKIIVSTNVAEASITVPGITAVVDCAREKRRDVCDGVQGLYISLIAKDKRTQRKGRAGRTAPGKYADCSGIPLDKREKTSTPEILRILLDQIVLQLKMLGIDATELNFLHSPSKEALLEAKKALTLLGAFDQHGQVTATGKAMSRYPVEVHYARMLVEAEKRGVLDDMLAIVACYEAGSIRARKTREEIRPKWWALTEERQSDFLAELDCFRRARHMPRQTQQEQGILPKQLSKARELYRRFLRDYDVTSRTQLITAEERLEVIKSIVAGSVDRVYKFAHMGYRGTTGGTMRSIDHNSVVREGSLVVADAFDLSVEKEGLNGEKYTTVKPLLNAVTAVQLNWLVKAAPELVEIEETYSFQDGEVVVLRWVTFNGHLLGATHTPASQCPDATRALAAAMAAGKVDYPDKAHNNQVRALTRRIARRDASVQPFDDLVFTAWLAERLGDVYRVADLDRVDVRLDPAELLPAEFADVITNDLTPKTIAVSGVSCEVIYACDSYGDISAEIKVPAAHVLRLQHLPPVEYGARVERVIAVGDDGAVVASSFNLSFLRRQLEQQQRDAAKQDACRQLIAEIADLVAEADRLENEGRNVTGLRGHIRTARSHLQSYEFYDDMKTMTACRSAIRSARKEIERLGGDLVEVLLDDLISGQLYHHDIIANRQMLLDLQVWVIRSGGYFELPTPEQLRRYYQTQLEGVTCVKEALQRPLAISLETYAPMSDRKEMEASGDLAPGRIAMARKGRTVEYPVTYAYEEIDGERVATGTIKVPLSVYEPNAADVGRKSSFPELPHGIRLMLEVTRDGVSLARGEDTVAFRAKVIKAKKQAGKGRQQSDSLSGVVY